jgi:hypothetical protein
MDSEYNVPPPVTLDGSTGPAPPADVSGIPPPVVGTGYNVAPPVPPDGDTELQLAADVGGIPLPRGLDSGVADPPPPAAPALAPKSQKKRKAKSVPQPDLSDDPDAQSGDQRTAVKSSGKHLKAKKSKVSIPPPPPFNYDLIKAEEDRIIDQHGFNLNTRFDIEQCSEDKNLKQWKTKEEELFLKAGFPIYHSAPGYKRDIFLDLTLRFLNRFPNRLHGFVYDRETIVDDFFRTAPESDRPAPWSDAQHWHLLLWLKVRIREVPVPFLLNTIAAADSPVVHQ